MNEQCKGPVSFEALIDYWAQDSTPEETERIEEHLFACDACHARLTQIAELAGGVARVVSGRGGLVLPMTTSLVDRLQARGVRMRHYRLGPGDVVPCGVGAEDDLLVTWLRAELEGVSRVDITMRNEQGPMGRIEDVPIDAITGQVIYSFGADAVRTFPAMTLTVELIAVEEDRERRLAEYTLHHAAFRG
jgi:anti-sigma factor RsiW